MKLLIVNYYRSPMIGAHAYRWSQLAEYWSQKGWEIDYICSKEGGGEIGEKNYRAIGVGFSRKRMGTLVSRVDEQKKISWLDSVKRSVLMVSRKVYQSLFWPDGLWHWLPFSFISICKNRHHKYDAIVSYSPTFSAHLAVLIYKKIYKDSVTWIADYGDPFSLSYSMPPNNFKLYRGLNSYIERSIVNACNYLVFTNNETKQIYEKSYSCKGNMKIIPHLVNLDEFYSGPSIKSNNSELNLVYVGGLHKGVREPYLAISVIGELVKLLRDEGVVLKVDFYGPLNGIDLSSSDSVDITWHGVVNRDKAIDVMKGADILLNIENINCVMTPSKIVEYIATGKPIINIVEQNKSELLGLYESVGYCYSISSLDDVRGGMSFIQKTRKGGGSREVVFKFIEEYDLVNIADNYEKLFL